MTKLRQWKGKCRQLICRNCFKSMCCDTNFSLSCLRCSENITTDVEKEPVKPVKAKATTESKPKGKANEGKKAAKHSSDEEDSGDESSFIVAPAKSAFALLDIDSGEDVSEPEEPVEVAPKKPAKKPKAKPTETSETKPAPAPAKKSSKKKEKKAPTEDDDDLDKMIAELKLEYNEPEQPVVATGKKGKKQKGNKAEATKVSEKTESVPVAAPATKEKTPEEQGKSKKEKKPKEAPKDDAKDKDQEGADGKKKKGPNKAMVAIMQERLKLLKEEEERAKVSLRRRLNI